MMPQPLYRKLDVNSGSRRGVAGNFRRIPFLRDLALHRFQVAAKLCTRIPYWCGPRWHYVRSPLQYFVLRRISVQRNEFFVRTRIKYAQTVPVATLRRTKRSHLLQGKDAGRIERSITTGP